MIPFRRIVLAGAALLAAGSVAAGVTGAAAVKVRQSHMKAMGAAAKALGEQFRSGAPDLAVIRVQAAHIDQGARDLPNWFPAGSGPQPGVKTHALPLIWSDPAGFKAKQQGLQLAAAKFNAAAAGGDMAALGADFRAVGEACKSCHDRFKSKDQG